MVIIHIVCLHHNGKSTLKKKLHLEGHFVQTYDIHNALWKYCFFIQSARLIEL
jgi:hypothetical protein